MLFARFADWFAKLNCLLVELLSIVMLAVAVYEAFSPAASCTKMNPVYESVPEPL